MVVNWVLVWAHHLDQRLAVLMESVMVDQMAHWLGDLKAYLLA
jgi:hypothetical protein